MRDHRGHALPDTTINIALRYNANLAMLDEIWSCSARQFRCCRGAVAVLRAVAVLSENGSVDDDTAPAESSQRR